MTDYVDQTGDYSPMRSIEAEQAILGALLNNPDAYEEVQSILTEDHFTRQDHALIYRAISKVIESNQSLDIVSAYEWLKKNGADTLTGGLVYLNTLMTNCPSAANIKTYTDIVHEKFMLRAVCDVGNMLATQAQSSTGQTPDEILAIAEETIMALREATETQNKGFEPFNILAERFISHTTELSHHQDQPAGIKTHFKNLDNVLNGLQPSDLIVLAGRPSMGKTSLAINIAESIAINDKRRVAIFSMEMSSDQLTARIYSSVSRVPTGAIRSGRLSEAQWEALFDCSGKIERSPIYIDDTPGLSIAELSSRARRLAAKVGQLDLIVIDYIQLMKGSSKSNYNGNRTMEISEISRGLKILAKELNCPIIALSQLNRMVESRVDKRPIMSDLRESGAIEQDADVIMFIYRDWVYDKSSDPMRAELIIRKQRNGGIGTLLLQFQVGITHFETFPGETGFTTVE